jgi:DNA-binding MurR/RpiR family transcriptional regulator
MLLSEGSRRLPDEKLEERHLRLLRAIDEVARHSPAGVSTMYQAAQKVGLDTVGKEADREEFVRLVDHLREAGYVDGQGITYMGLRASYSVTEEGHRRLEE